MSDSLGLVMRVNWFKQALLFSTHNKAHYTATKFQLKLFQNKVQVVLTLYLRLLTY